MPPIRFILSSAFDSLVDDVDNAVFSVDGKPVYQTETPLKLSQRITSLKRLCQVSELEAKGEGLPPPNYEKLSEAPSGGPDVVKVGEIEYHEFSPTIFQYEGKTVDEHHMFLKSSLFNSLLTGDRKFIGIDGHTYAWQIGLDGMELAKKHEHDKKSDIVATWNPRRFGVIHDHPVPPCLEILPAAQHMMDHIFLTFIFVHYETHK